MDRRGGTSLTFHADHTFTSEHFDELPVASRCSDPSALSSGRWAFYVPAEGECTADETATRGSVLSLAFSANDLHGSPASSVTKTILRCARPATRMRAALQPAISTEPTRPRSAPPCTSASIRDRVAPRARPVDVGLPCSAQQESHRPIKRFNHQPGEPFRSRHVL